MIKRITMITLERFIAGSDLVHRRDPGPTTSPTEEAAITQRIRNANPSFFWPTLLLPAPRRNAIQALYFFCRELRGIADGTPCRRSSWHSWPIGERRSNCSMPVGHSISSLER